MGDTHFCNSGMTTSREVFFLTTLLYFVVCVHVQYIHVFQDGCGSFVTACHLDKQVLHSFKHWCSLLIRDLGTLSLWILSCNVDSFLCFRFTWCHLLAM